MMRVCSGPPMNIMSKKTIFIYFRNGDGKAVIPNPGSQKHKQFYLYPAFYVAALSCQGCATVLACSQGCQFWGGKLLNIRFE